MQVKVSEIGEIFKNHDALFATSRTRDQNMLMVYLMYERLNGEKSFYSPYFDAVN